MNHKYYTASTVAKMCIDKTYAIIGKDKITEVIEPCAGNGSFSNLIENSISYDIEPAAEGIIQQDFLKLKKQYKTGRLIIGALPLQSVTLCRWFIKKAYNIADYASFIMPLNQLNISGFSSGFDLTHSERIGLTEFSDRYVHCCLNIYTAPPRINKSEDLTMCCQAAPDFDTFEYDARIGYRGRVLSEYEGSPIEIKLRVNNQAIKEEVLKLFKSIKWTKEEGFPKNKIINQKFIYQVMKKYMPTLN